MPSYIYNYLPLEHRACLAASAISYNFDVPRLRGDCMRSDFTVSDSKESVSFKYVPELSDETIVVFVNEKACIVAFRGTQFSSPERFLGIAANEILTLEEQSASPNERSKILMQYCPSDSGVGCNTSTTSMPGKLPLAGGLVVDSGSDCIADSAITHRQEHKSRLHQLCADRYDEIAKSMKKHNLKLYVTGHSLGGNLAAFALHNSKTKGELVLFSAGCGPDGPIPKIFENLFTICRNRRKQNPAYAQKPIRNPKKKVYKELPRSETAWPKKTVMYREACDVVSAYGVSWWPTISFLFKRNETSYCELLPRKTDSHSLANYLPNSIYLSWCSALEDLPSDASKDVVSYEGFAEKLKDYGL